MKKTTPAYPFYMMKSKIKVYNSRWLTHHLKNAGLRANSIIKKIETNQISTTKQLFNAIIPVYLRMNLAWNGCCYTGTKIPIDAYLAWVRLPLDFWEYENVEYGMVKLKRHKHRKIPKYLKKSILSDLREGVSGLGDETTFLLTLGQLKVDIAHSYRHLNTAINTAFEMTQKEFKIFYIRPDSMKLFYDYSRWPELVVEDTGPKEAIKLQKKLKFKY
jgi:hypothetical protein